jgi:hypothetical protein
MTKWLVAVGATVLLVGFLLWQLKHPGAATPPVITSHDAGIPPTTPSEDQGKAPVRDTAGSAAGTRPTEVPADDAGAAAAEVVKLDPASDAFSQRVDVDAAARFRRALAPCYKGGLDPDLTLKLHMRLHVIRGEVFANDVRVADSKLGDQALEQCMVAAVEHTRWRDDELPDVDEDQELFIRLMTLVKYKDPDEQVRDKERAHRNDDDADDQGQSAP